MSGAGAWATSLRTTATTAWKSMPPGLFELVNNTSRSTAKTIPSLAGPHGDGKGIDINLNDVGVPFNTSGPLNIYPGFQHYPEQLRGRDRDASPAETSSSHTEVDMLGLWQYHRLELGPRRGRAQRGNLGQLHRVRGRQHRRRLELEHHPLERIGRLLRGQYDFDQPAAGCGCLGPDGRRYRIWAGFNGSATPNLTLDIDGNQIQQNGLPANTGQLNGSGLVIRVGRAVRRPRPSTIPDRDGFDSFSGVVGVGNQQQRGVRKRARQCPREQQRLRREPGGGRADRVVRLHG